ncbi:coiled-coil domain-containing protein 68 isoform X1 [Ornithorhynchus anatinus]|nr:coiled-coil domain-containing protein 68 isoform X1 [Ornithorhynchus anatinus]XP_028916617.1 coiled-coil domain-containing protein 68 isoform X1 [Ornithorhynchus anatinus]
MTALEVTGEVLKDEQGFEEDENYVVYGCSPTQIMEETQYIKTIRSTLEKIRSQFKEDNHKIIVPKFGSKQHFQNVQDVSQFEPDASRSNFNQITEKMKEKDLQLLKINEENEILKIKLEASREAGASALRNVAQKLDETYQRQSEEFRKKHEDDKHLIQVGNLEKEQTFKQHLESLHRVAERLEDKSSQITEMEKLVKRMEEEKRLLIERKKSFEAKLPHLTVNSKNPQSFQNLEMEISTLQEQISHLENVIHSQHQNLRNVIQETETLKNDVEEQDEKIENLKEKIIVLEAQNKVLKKKMDLWSECTKLKVSKAVSTGDSLSENTSPYLMLIRLRK